MSSQSVPTLPGLFLLPEEGSRLLLELDQKVTPEVAKRIHSMPTLKLSQESARLLSSMPGLKVERVLMTPEEREYFASRLAHTWNGTDTRGSSNRSRNDSKRAGQATNTTTNRPRYSPLKSNEFRLLIVKQGTDDEPIRCQLQHCSLQSSSHYEALSYTWGNPIRTRHYSGAPTKQEHDFSPEAYMAAALAGRVYTTMQDGNPFTQEIDPMDEVNEYDLMCPVTVTLDGSECNVSGNLAAALGQLRLPSSDRALWVDALCINQDDVQERNEQVKKMDTIYRRCNLVRIWLGPAADGSDLAMWLVKYIWNYKHVYGLNPIEIFSRTETVVYLKVLEDLTILLMRPWFTRRWVVQELAFARDAMVHCGERSVEWRKLEFAILYLKSYRFELNYLRIRNLYLTARVNSYRRGYLQELAAASFACVRSDTIRRSSPQSDIERLAGIETLLGTFHTLRTGDPHDTIYALLALASDTHASSTWVPDYRKPVLELYIDVVSWIIKENKSINILCRPWAQKIGGSSAQLPSWIKHYAPAATRHEGGADISQDRLLFVGDGRGTRFRAAKGSHAGAKVTYVDGVGRVLMAVGFIVDHLETVGESARQQELPRSWISTARTQACKPAGAGRTNRHAKYSANETDYEAFADVLVAGQGQSNGQPNRYANDLYAPMCEALFADNSPYRTNRKDNDLINIFEVSKGPSPPPLYPIHGGEPFAQSDIHTFLNHIQASTPNRAIARTGKGALALVEGGPSLATKGDLVSVLFGCDVPVLLRQIPCRMESSDSLVHGVYEFVGEAYVQGIMYGEAFTEMEELAKRGVYKIGGFLLL